MKFLPVVLIAVFAFILGFSVKDGFVAPFNAASEKQDEASESGQVSQDLVNLPELSGEAAPAGKTFSQNGNTYTSYSLDDKIVLKGLYRLSTYNVNFMVILPKNGGAIEGELTGTCEGKITGTVEKPTKEGFAPLRGEYSGTCKPVPTLGFKTNASGTFEGKADYNNKKATVRVDNKEPITLGSTFEMNF